MAARLMTPEPHCSMARNSCSPRDNCDGSTMTLADVVLTPAAPSLNASTTVSTAPVARCTTAPATIIARAPATRDENNP